FRHTALTTEDVVGQGDDAAVREGGGGSSADGKRNLELVGVRVALAGDGEGARHGAADPGEAVDHHRRRGIPAAAEVEDILDHRRIRADQTRYRRWNIVHANPQMPGWRDACGRRDHLLG